MKSKTPEYRAAYWQKWRAQNIPPTIKVCAVCGEEYQPERGGTKTCKVCREGACAHCGERFPRRRLATKYCSNTCKDDAARGAEPPHLAANRGRKARTYFKRKRDKRGGAEDREWRKAIFERDNYTCQGCGKRGGRLNADHIKPFSTHPHWRHLLSNGRTLCVECHKKTDTYGWRGYWMKVRSRRMAQEVLPL